MKTLRKCFLAILGILSVMAFTLSIAACGEKTVTLSFDAHGGPAVESVEATPGQEVTLPTPEREGYTFEGWYPSEALEGDPLGNPLIAPEEDATYHAKWTALPAITLDLDGGTLAEGNLYLKAGENLYSFMQSRVPTKTNRQFGEWLSGDAPLASNAKMPAEGITLKAHWKVPYTLNIYKQNLALDNYVKDEALSSEGFGYAGETVRTDSSVQHFVLNGEMSHSVVLEDRDENVADFYYDRDSYFIVYDANAPEGADEVQGEMEEETYPYETEPTVKASGFSLDGYRFLGWSTQKGGKAEYAAGETMSPLDRDITLYAVWDGDRYTDAFDGVDNLFLGEDGVSVYLQRAGLPEIEGVLDADGYFTFTGKDFELKGRIDRAKKTFVYLVDAEQREYVSLDPYASLIDFSVVFTIGDYDTASIAFYDYTEEGRGDLLKKIDGTYAMDAPHWGDLGIYTFHANSAPGEGYEDYEVFNFQTGSGTLNSEPVWFFAIQGKEATNGSLGTYLTMTQTGFTYPVLVLNGFGGCAYLRSPDSDPVTTISYMPANYTGAYFYADDDEYVILNRDSSLFGLVKVGVTIGYDSQNNPSDVGYFLVNDGSTGPYDCTYTDADGNSVTERVYMDGYGNAVYYGKVTVGEDGTESYEFTKNCTYSPAFTYFYPILEEVDDEEGSAIGIDVGTPVNYNRTVFTDEEGKEYTFSVSSTPAYSFNSQEGTGSWTRKGVLAKLDATAGSYFVESSRRVRGSEISSSSSAPANYPYYLFDWRLYVTGAPRTASGSYGSATDNYAELWGMTGFNVDGYDTSERICSGNLLPTEEQTPDGYTVYQLTVTKANISSSTTYNGYAVGTVIELYFLPGGTAVFLETEEVSFTSSEGETLSVDKFGKAHYTPQGGEATDATFTTSPVGVAGVMYSFVAGDKTFDFFRPNTGSEGYELLGDIYTQDENNAVGLTGWNASYRSLSAYTSSQMIALSGDRAILYVFYEEYRGGGIFERTYILFGSVQAVEDKDGVYKFTKIAGPSSSINSFPVPFEFKYLGENGFAIYTNRLELNATDGANGTLVADGFGTATYTDGTGAQHTGKLQIVAEYSKSAGLWNDDTNSRDTARGQYLYRIVEENGAEWNFSLESINGSFNAADRKTFRVAGDFAGVYWIIENNDGNGSMTSNYYLYDGLHVYEMAGNSSNSARWIGKIEESTEAPNGVTLTLSKLYGTGSDTLNLALRKKENNLGRMRSLSFVYNDAYALDYTVVDTDGKETARLFGDGYDFMGLTYTEVGGKEYRMRVSEFNAEEGYLSVEISDGETQSSIIFDILDGNKLSARTLLAFDAFNTNRQLTDNKERLVSDGHGNGSYYPIGSEGIEGFVEHLDGSVYSFESTDGKISFLFTLYADSAQNFYFSIHMEGFSGFFYETESFTSLWLDGDENATYYGIYGQSFDGKYNILGKDGSILEFYSDRAGYHYYFISYDESGAPLPELVPVQGDYAYIDNVVYGYQGGAEASALPAGVDTIGFAAFYNKPVVTIDLSGVKTVEDYAFANCEALQTVTGASSVETIGRYGFFNCLALSEIDLTGVKTIGEYGMDNVISLASVHLDSIEEIGDFAFHSDYGAASSIFGNHPKLIEAHIGENIRHIGTRAFSNLHVFASDGSILSIYFHTKPDADYDSIITENEVFYQTEIAFYVDSVEVAKAIYGSKMATLYRSTGAQQAYHQIIRIATEGDTEEYGFYLRADYTATTSSDVQIVRLDGMLADGDGATSKEYRNLCYIKEGNTLRLTGYDPDAEGHFTEETATLSEDGGIYKLEIGGRVFVRLSDSLPIVYTNGNDKLSITGTVSVTNGKFSATLQGVYLNGEIQTEGALTKTDQTSSRAGYVRMNATSKYDYQFALATDLTFTVPTAIDYFEGPNSNQRITVTTTRSGDTVTQTLSFSTNLSDADGLLGKDVTIPRSYVEATNLNSASNYTFEGDPVFTDTTITAHVKGKNSNNRDYEWIFNFTLDRVARTYTVKTDLVYGIKTFEGYRSETYGRDFGFKVILDSREGETKMTDVYQMMYRDFGKTTAFSSVGTSSATKEKLGENEWYIFSTSTSSRGAFRLTYIPAKDGKAEELKVEELTITDELYSGDLNDMKYGDCYASFLLDKDGNALNVTSYALNYYSYDKNGRVATPSKLSYSGSNLAIEKKGNNTFDLTVKGYIKVGASGTTNVTLHFTVTYHPEGKNFTIDQKDEIIIREFTDTDGVLYRALFVKDQSGKTTLMHFEYLPAGGSSYTKATVDSSGSETDGAYAAHYGNGNSRADYSITLTDDGMTVTKK